MSVTSDERPRRGRYFRNISSRAWRTFQVADSGSVSKNHLGRGQSRMGLLSQVMDRPISIVSEVTACMPRRLQSLCSARHQTTTVLSSLLPLLWVERQTPICGIFRHPALPILPSQLYSTYHTNGLAGLIPASDADPSSARGLCRLCGHRRCSR